MQFLELLLDWQNLRLDFGVDAVIYAVMALAGTTLFLLRLIVSLLLGGGGADFISLLSLTAFFMGAGWMGLIARVDWGLGPTPAAFASGGFGFTLMLLSASLMFGARKLTQDVTYDTKTAVGRTGQVYMAIPPKGGGSGQVRVSVSGRSMIVNANSAGPALEAFTDVKVVDVRDDQTLIVEPVEG